MIVITGTNTVTGEPIEARLEMNSDFCAECKVWLTSGDLLDPEFLRDRLNLECEEHHLSWLPAEEGALPCR